MSVELHRDTPIFDRKVSVRQCQGPSESRNTPLDFRVISGSRAITGGSSGQSERLFHFEVADENDPYFLYVLDVGEQDFHLLKKDQALLVEFPVFPTKMVDLLQLCLDSESTDRAAADAANAVDDGSEDSVAESIPGGASTFVCKLDTASGVFSIVELNEFKQLTHISLQMRQGNDNAIKSYLASRLGLYMDRCETMSGQLSSATQTLQNEHKEKKEIQKGKLI
jgi:spindle assembly abnormal protein 6